MRKRSLALALVFVLLSALFSLIFSAAAFSDVPSGDWSEDAVALSVEYGLFKGDTHGRFGYGREISRAEFVTVLCRMFGWPEDARGSSGFEDVSENEWYSGAVLSAKNNGVLDNEPSFRPNKAITREEIAVMLVRALGLQSVAESQNNRNLPFKDVTRNTGYIALAYDIGMINGTTPETFAPERTAKREQAAAMLTRVYSKLITQTGFLHGFYAISSYDQRYVIESLDAVTFGWSRMTLDNDKGVWLNTARDDTNQWGIPQSYEEILGYIGDTKAHLGVFMDNSSRFTLPDGTESGSLDALLKSPEFRAAAVDEIVREVTRVYENIGHCPYSGVTIDFEGLRGADVKAAFTDFLSLLSSELESRSLYVTVQPALPDGVYFDGFDYRAIGRLSDKVILMAHDYNPFSLDGYIGTEWYKNTALTPINSVYHSLRAVTDPETGVEDSSKLVLALSFGSLAWELDSGGKLASAKPYRPESSLVARRLAQPDTVTGWSESYANPYAQYSTEDGQSIFIWFEDSRSVSEKLKLAALFGINGVSLWRIGLIPDYAGVYDVWSDLSVGHAS